MINNVMLSLDDIKEGDFVQQKSIKKLLKVVRDKTTNQLGVRTIEVINLIYI